MNWKEAEEIACSFLKKKGYKILQRNYRTRYGEIDVVALYRGTVVFIEVKSGSSSVDPLDRIDSRKVRSIVLSALCYMKEKGETRPVRVDFVRVLPNSIEHIEGVWLG